MARARPALVALFALGACSGLGELAPDDHLVAAPVSARANVVLESLIVDYGSKQGRWGGCLSAGCTTIWATQFGYRAGVRRGRDDLVELARVTAARQATDLRGLAWEALFGADVDPDDPAVFGFPALVVSGTLGGRQFDGYLFERTLEVALERSDTLDARQSAGLGALLATSALLVPDEREERLSQARERAQAAGDAGGGTWGLLAWCAIARASGRADDLARARAALAATSYVFDELGRLQLPFEDRDEVLSRHLALVHGLGDLAQVSGDPFLQRAATSLLEHVFSDAYFDGRLLIHDRVNGPSERVCSGCNFMALYLVDRLYGDSFVVATLPALPDAAPSTRATAPGPAPRWDTLLFLGPGADGAPGRLETRVAQLGDEGALSFRHESEPVSIEVRFRIVELGGSEALEADVRAHFGELTESTISAGFDDSGRARLHLGSAPLIVRLVFERDEDGALAASVELRESDPTARSPGK